MVQCGSGIMEEWKIGFGAGARSLHAGRLRVETLFCPLALFAVLQLHAVEHATVRVFCAGHVLLLYKPQGVPPIVVSTHNTQT